VPRMRGAQYVFPFKQYGSAGYDGTDDGNYFWYVETWEVGASSFRPSVRGSVTTKKVKHPKRRDELIDVYLVDETPPDDGSDSAMISYRRIWSPEVPDIEDWELRTFNRLNLDGLKSKTGGYYGVSYDNGETNFVFSGRKPVQEIGSLDELVIREGADMVPEPGGNLILTFEDSEKDFTVDLSKTAAAIETAISAESTLELQVQKSSINVVLVGSDVESFVGLSIEGLDFGIGFEYQSTPGRLEILFISSSSTPTGILSLQGGEEEIFPNLACKGALSVNFNNPYDVRNFTIPDLSQTEEAIGAWIKANTLFQQVIVQKQENVPDGSGGVYSQVKVFSIGTEHPVVENLSGSMTISFSGDGAPYGFTIPDLSQDDATIEQWILNNTAFTKPPSGGFWRVGSGDELRVAFAFNHPSFAYPPANVSDVSLGGLAQYDVGITSLTNSIAYFGIGFASPMPENIYSDVSNINVSGGDYPDVIPTTSVVTTGVVGLYIKWEISTGSTAAAVVSYPSIQLDISRSVAALTDILEGLGAENVSINKDSTTATISWDSASSEDWLPGEDIPANTKARSPGLYESIEIAGVSGKTCELSLSGNSITLEYTEINLGSLTTYETPSSLRRFKIEGHGYPEGLKIPFWLEDELVAKSTVVEVEDVDHVLVPVEDVPGSDFKATHVGDLNYLTELQGGAGQFDARITTQFFIEGLGDVSTGDDVPDVELEASAQKQLDVVSLGNEYFVAEILEKGRIRDSVQWMIRKAEMKTLEVFGSYVIPEADPVDPNQGGGDTSAVIEIEKSDLLLAFATVQVVDGFDEKIMTLYRASDGATLDVKFVDGLLPINEIVTWAQAGDVHVMYWANQGNVGGGATQVEFADMPWIVRGGIICTDSNGHVCVDFNDPINRERVMILSQDLLVLASQGLDVFAFVTYDENNNDDSYFIGRYYELRFGKTSSSYMDLYYPNKTGWGSFGSNLILGELQLHRVGIDDGLPLRTYWLNDVEVFRDTSSFTPVYGSDTYASFLGAGRRSNDAIIGSITALFWYRGYQSGNDRQQPYSDYFLTENV